MDYMIFADVSIDIDMAFADKYDLKYISMEYILDDNSFNCSRPENDEMMHQYYEKLRLKASTHTSQIVPNNYVEAFEGYIKEGKGILYISLSSGLSNTYESALLAAKMLKDDYPECEIEVVDSLGATGGMGILAESACLNREKGMSLSDNAKWLREHANNINFWFKVEDLMYLCRGGRVSATTAVVGTALKIKPILTIDSTGKLQTIDKKRGDKQAMLGLIERFEETYDPDMGNTVYVSCADCRDVAETLKSKLLEKHPDLDIKITMLSPIIGAHTGPDMLSLIYYGSKRTY